MIIQFACLFDLTCKRPFIYLFILSSHSLNYLWSTGGGRAPEGVHGGQVLGLYGWRRASTGSAVGVAGEPLVHLPGGTERERDTCRSRRTSDVTCSGAGAAAHKRVRGGGLRGGHGWCYCPAVHQ